MKYGILLLVCVAYAATPLTPVWPTQFWQNFTEITSYPIYGTHSNTGTYYYNYDAKTYRIDRNNGQYDRYCGLSGPYRSDNTPCSHIVNNGNRYLYFPVLNTCCYCCNSTQGCGMLFPTWMNHSTYIDTEVHEGQTTYKWEEDGLQKNFIYETVGSVPVNRVTVSIVQEPDDTMNFGPRSLTLPANIFNLPSICNLQNTCNWGACQDIRESAVASNK